MEVAALQSVAAVDRQATFTDTAVRTFRVKVNAMILISNPLCRLPSIAPQGRPCSVIGAWRSIVVRYGERVRVRAFTFHRTSGCVIHFRSEPYIYKRIRVPYAREDGTKMMEIRKQEATIKPKKILAKIDFDSK